MEDEVVLLLVHVTWFFGFDSGAQFPDEGTELTGDGDFDFVVMHPASGQCHEAGVESQLGAP